MKQTQSIWENLILNGLVPPWDKPLLVELNTKNLQVVIIKNNNKHSITSPLSIKYIMEWVGVEFGNLAGEEVIKSFETSFMTANDTLKIFNLLF